MKVHELELKLAALLSTANKKSLDIPEETIEEFGELCKAAFRKQFNTTREDKFRLRMSNIGKPLRQLHMDKLYGEDHKEPEFKLLVTYGDIIEALVVTLLKVAGVEMVGESGKVKLRVAEETVKGEYDNIYRDQVTKDKVLIDIKSCSPFAFDNKFKDWESFKEKDSFGYRLQGFGYDAADKEVDSDYFGGLFVVNKVNGKFKYLEVPKDIYDEEKKESLQEIKKVVEHFKYNKPMPSCTGVKEEIWYKKPTGEKVIACGAGEPCQFCNRKDKCHPELEYRQGENGKGKKYFIDKDKEITYNV